MFHLTSKKYIFFAISLLVIIPGTLALLVWHLNPGIDFTGGTTVDLRFQQSVPSGASSTVSQAFISVANAKDVQVFISHQIGQTGQTVWVELDTPVDSFVQQAILNRFTSQPSIFGTVTALPSLNQLSTNGGKTTISLLPFQFTALAGAPAGSTFNVTLAQVNKALTTPPLPNTALPTTTGAPASTATPTTTGTPAATATPSPTATATATPAAGSSGTEVNPNPNATTPVKVLNTYESNNNEIVTVQTQTALNPTQLQNVESQLFTSLGPVYQSQVQSVSPAIASSTTFEAIVAVIFAAIAILLYITFAFRNVGSFGQSIKYATCAIIALLHDVLVVLGIWAILGHLFPSDFKVDTLFVTAVLTVIGFSVHDTIVVFDRIRENAQRRSNETFIDIVNASLLQTMARSLNTSLTVLITLSALTLFGGASIRTFTLALLIGIFSGTYSSIFNASMLLVVWETKEYRRWFGREPRAISTTTRGARVATTR